MGSNPINLGVRLILELVALFAFGNWGWNASDGIMRYVLAIGLPILAAAAWGIFAVVDDPSRSGNAPVPVSGAIRLVLELVFFALATFALYSVGSENWALAFATIVLVHYAVSYDRIAWLLKQTGK
jgi:hypothetical protein